MCVERRNREGVEAGVDLTDLLLLGGGGLFFDDSAGVWTLGALAQHAAVSEGIGQFGGEQGHGGFLGRVKFAELLNGFRRDQRGVAGEHDDLVVGRERFAGHHQSVSSAALLSLQDEIHAGVGKGRAHTVSFMADDREDVRGWHDLGGRCDHVGQNWFAADFMENLGMLGFEPRSFARSHDCDGHA